MKNDPVLMLGVFWLAFASQAVAAETTTIVLGPKASLTAYKALAKQRSNRFEPSDNGVVRGTGDIRDGIVLTCLSDRLVADDAKWATCTLTLQEPN